MECSFYSHVGLCRHGKKCSKKHVQVEESEYLIISNMYTGEDLDTFVVDLFTETNKIAPIREFLIAANTPQHIYGTVIIRFYDKRDCQDVLSEFESRWYNEKPLFCSLSPIRSLTDACCKDQSRCERGPSCNYIHAMKLPRDLMYKLWTCRER